MRKRHNSSICKISILFIVGFINLLSTGHTGQLDYDGDSICFEVLTIGPFTIIIDDEAGEEVYRVDEFIVDRDFPCFDIFDLD